jgi:hypothetical protein
MNDKFVKATHRRVNLHCKTRFVTDGDILIEAGKYEGYTINALNGEQRTFLLLPPGPSQIDVTDQANHGLLMIFRG